MDGIGIDKKCCYVTNALQVGTNGMMMLDDGKKDDGKLLTWHFMGW